ncbi:urate hydroxylase PuuD [Colwellia sp. C1TZA3]|uniref:urate hydroxylase PuuD n=1 Tax=Colwellia sp. C1TZA3 TaxID=2508879 RepID=UPI0011B97EC6|nr:urate hydroxylase PuuD [Colwellia sp. C1TZA3]TWX71177.1 urate hydroxylase PuuD [Colwellia sp. C1TZA3]
MEAYFFDVLNFLVRSLHIITGIAWIGASFYFVMLDNSLSAPKKSTDVENGMFGELWAVHGGGFYHSQKYMLGPKNDKLDDNLHWSKWEAYSTWISGFFLMAIVYWYGADIYLIDPQIADMSQSTAILISLGFMFGGYIIYDFLCKSALAKNDLVLGIVIFVLVSIAAYVLTHIFSGRGAFMTFGAMLGTIMAASVFFVIIPGQKQMVERLRAGEKVDSAPGIAGRQRSVHNTYFTLPVIFVMISNHYAMTYSHEYNWLILMGISMAGALIRVFFVSRHGPGKPFTGALIAAFVIMAAVIWAMAPKTLATNLDSSVAAVEFSQVETIIEQRCASCHAQKPTYPGFAAAPKGYMYDTPQQIKAQAAQIYQQAVVLKAMPIGNLTGITDEERAVLGTWYQQLQAAK